MTDDMSLQVELDAPHATAVEKVTAALKQEGFGVLTKIDIQDAFKEKLNVEFRPYTILGACNPPLAHRALSASADVGLLLPCNVTVETAASDRSLVRIVNPLEMMKAGPVAQDEEIQAVAQEAAARLQRVAESLQRR